MDQRVVRPAVLPFETLRGRAARVRLLRGKRPEPRGQNHCNLGLAQVALRQTERSLDSFDRAIALDESFADAWQQRGLLRLTAKRLGLASRDLEQALKHGALASDVRFTLSRIAMERGRTNECIGLLQQVLDQEPNHLEALALRAKLQPSPRLADGTGACGAKRAVPAVLI